MSGLEPLRTAMALLRGRFARGRSPWEADWFPVYGAPGEADADELVMFRPWAPGTEAGSELLARALRQAVEASATRLSASVGSVRAAAAILIRAGVCGPVGIPLAPQPPAAGMIPWSSLNAWVGEAMLLACLADLERGCGPVGDHRSDEEPMSFAATLAASVAAGMNSAHWASRFGCMHETLSLAAWLGQLLRNRPAVLPPPIAETALDLLGGRRGDDDWDDGAGALLMAVAEHASGRDRLVAAARRVMASGRPVLVAPNVRVGRPLSLTDPWDCALEARVRVSLIPFVSKDSRHA